MKIGIQIDGPGVEGISTRANTRTGIATTLNKENDRKGVVVCDTIFGSYPETEGVRSKLMGELSLQGARCLAVIIYDDTVAPGRSLTRDEYIAVLLQELRQAQLDLNKLKSAIQP